MLIWIGLFLDLSALRIKANYNHNNEHIENADLELSLKRDLCDHKKKKKKMMVATTNSTLTKIRMLIFHNNPVSCCTAAVQEMLFHDGNLTGKTQKSSQHSRAHLPSYNVNHNHIPTHTTTLGFDEQAPEMRLLAAKDAPCATRIWPLMQQSVSDVPHDVTQEWRF